LSEDNSQKKKLSEDTIHKTEFLMLIYYLSHQAVAYYYHGLVLDEGGEPATISAQCAASLQLMTYFQTAKGLA
jgi:hypothetical protein